MRFWPIPGRKRCLNLQELRRGIFFHCRRRHRCFNLRFVLHGAVSKLHRFGTLLKLQCGHVLSLDWSFGASYMRELHYRYPSAGKRKECMP